MSLKRRPKPKKSLYRLFTIRKDPLEIPEPWSKITIKGNVVGDEKK